MPLPVLQEDEALHREMERISLDWVMIQNPTEDDFYIEWAAKDGRPWKYLVPNKNKDIGWGSGKLEVQRYLAVWYCKHMKDKIINDQGIAEAEKILTKRQSEGKPELTKYEEQKAIWEKNPRTTSDKEMAKLYPILFLGVSREFGMDYAPTDQPLNVDLSTPEEKALENLKNKKYTPSTESAPKSKPKESKELPSVEELEALMPKK